MANYKGHIAGAVAVNTAFIVGLTVLPGGLLDETGGLFSQWQFVSFLYFVAMLFGLWPDIDTNSKGQDIFFGAGFLLDIVLIWQGYIEAAAYLGLLAMTPIVGKHRGWTHSKWAMVFVPLPIVIVSYLYRDSVLPAALLIYGAAVAGYFSHLLLDGRITRHIRFKT
jgi:membrane-bound metal-dependent hydrolase YbcI (DUF457 family)